MHMRIFKDVIFVIFMSTCHPHNFHPQNFIGKLNAHSKMVTSLSSHNHFLCVGGIKNNESMMMNNEFVASITINSYF